MVMIGGSLGALCRYSISLAAAKFSSFPLGTFLANMTGCFLIGAVFALADRTQILNPSLRLFLMTGFLGALTTFSTYALETIQSFRNGSVITALTNFILNNLFGLLLVLAGMLLVQQILNGD